MSAVRLPAPSFWRQSIVAVVDQAWLSLLNLAIGLLLIRLASPEDYGVYTQLFAGGVLAVILAESVLLNPLTTLAAALPAKERDALASHVNDQHARLSYGLAAGFGVLAMVVLQHTGANQPALLSILFAAYVHTSARREFHRSVGFLRHEPATVLNADLGYGVALALSLTTVLVAGHFTLPGIMAALVIANLWPLWRNRRVSTIVAKRSPDAHLQTQLWARGRLGLPGALATWLANYSYVFVVAAWLGAAAAAELNAARLLFMPTALLVIAWSRVARPKLGRLMAQAQRGELVRVLATSMLVLLSLILLYVSVVWLSLPWLLTHVLGDEYAGVTALLGLWVLYFGLHALRGIGAVFLLCADGYRMMLVTSLASLTALAIALPLGLHYLGTAGAVVALIAVELVQLFIIWVIGAPVVLRRLFGARHVPA